MKDSRNDRSKKAPSSTKKADAKTAAVEKAADQTAEKPHGKSPKK
ncbi:hypothetical protein [Flavobacterium agri]|nr:hypothetical protein [Flavobacterium agri]